MNARIQARVRQLFTTDESLTSRILRFADDFGLKITKASINDSMKVDTFKVPTREQETDVPSNTDFVSILMLLYILSYSSPNVCNDPYLNYLEITFQYKSRFNELRGADILFYEIFTDRMTRPR